MDCDFQGILIGLHRLKKAFLPYMNIIEIHNLTHTYGAQTVLSDLNLSVRRGELFIIIGPNGSGKTTLMKLTGGFSKLLGGEIRIFGKTVQSYSRRELARQVAYVPQMTPPDFPFTVAELVSMGRAPHQGFLGLDTESDIRAAEEAMTFTGVDHLARRRIDQLSGGEQQRVFVARAMCQDTDIILLDEPTAALDLAHQVRIMDLMEKLKTEKGVTVVMVSHDVNLAAMYGDRLLLLKKGSIAGLGTPEHVLTGKSLESAYECKVLVDHCPFGAHPRVTVVPGKYSEGDVALPHG
jgi:iron complex transport system ATP-binding protein